MEKVRSSQCLKTFLYYLINQWRESKLNKVDDDIKQDVDQQLIRWCTEGFKKKLIIQ